MNKPTRVWPLQEAKAKFSELVRRAQTEGPQVVTVHGKVAVTVMAGAPGEDNATKTKTGADLIRALQTCPYPEFDVPEGGEPVTVRPVDL